MPRIKNYKIILAILTLLIVSLIFTFLNVTRYSLNIDAYNITDDFDDNTYIDVGNSSNYILSSGQISASTKTYTFGTGADGACTVSGTININTQSCVGRANGDAVSFQRYTTFTANAGTYKFEVSDIPGSLAGLSVGDEVIIYKPGGLSGGITFVGEYEIQTIAGLDPGNNSAGNPVFGDSTITFENPLLFNYTTNNYTFLQRIPQYTNVTINAGSTFTADAYTGTAKSGLFMFKANGTVTVNGSINLDGKGYLGGMKCYGSCQSIRPHRGQDYGATRGSNGGSITAGLESGLDDTYSGGGGGGGLYNSGTCGVGGTGGIGGAGGGGGNANGTSSDNSKGGGGGGGGYGTGGSGGQGYNNGINGDEESGTGGDAFCDGISLAYAGGGGGGGTYGDIYLSNMIFGSGGGSGGSGNNTATSAGGNGGGTIYIQANNLNIAETGSISTNGTNGGDGGVYSGGGGGGAGGAIKLYTNTASLGSSRVTASGGSGGTGSYNGGDGGSGRIYTEYTTSISGVTTPSTGSSQLPQYENTSVIQSTDILPGDDNADILSFNYSLSSLPSGTSATAQFSTDATTWYNSSGVEDGTNSLSQGEDVEIDFSSLSWESDTFYYRIEFDNDSGASTPTLDEISLTYDQLPLAPTIESAQALTSSSIKWNFSDNSDNESGFKLFDSLDNLLLTENTQDLGHIDENSLSPNTQYIRKVTSFNDIGNSEYSSTVSKYTLAQIPTISTSTVTQSSIVLTSTNTDNLTSDTSGIFFNCISQGCDTGINSWIQTSSATSSSLEPNTQYTYRVKARNGESIETDYSSLISKYTLTPAPSLSTLALTSSSITLYATNTYNLTSGTSGMLFTCSQSNCNTGINEWIQSTTDTATGLIPNTAYSFTSKARNGESTLSSTSNILTKYTLANIPTVTCTSATSNSITLSLGKNSNPSNTNISINEARTNQYVDKSSGTLSSGISWGTFDEFNNNSSYIVKSLTPSTQFNFKIKARNGDGIESAYSADISCSTSASSTPLVPVNQPVPVIDPIEEEEVEVEDTDSNDITEEEKVAVTNILNDKSNPTEDVKEEDNIVVNLGKREYKVTQQIPVSTYINERIHLNIPVETISSLNPDSSVSGVYVENDGEIFKLALDSTMKFYKTTLNIFRNIGSTKLNILALYDDSKSVKMSMDVVVDPYGFVYENLNSQELRLKGAKITLYSKLNGSWSVYGVDNNPQYSNQHGEYSFFVDPGVYKIKAELDGYENYESEEFNVEKTIIKEDIQMERMSRNNYIYLYVVGIVVLLFSIFILGRKKK